jgi:hypothetical protein
MLSDVKIIRFFDSPSLAIIELKHTGFPDTTPIPQNLHWLIFDKHSDQFSEIDLRSVDSSGEVEERFFDQGFLKCNHSEATFIEKFNSAQHRLTLQNTADLPLEMLVKIKDLF